MKKQRLDDALVARGLYSSRSRARDAVLRRAVRVAGIVATRPAQTVSAETEIEIDDEARGYVSRAALKLIHALDHFNLSPEGCIALDLGTSTGGFTQVLLERGAVRVTAIDVGHGQLAECLRADPRVTVIEGLNARDLARAHLAEPPPQFITADVSFISLNLALPPALDLAAPGASLVALIKPQFEVGRDALGKAGIVKDPALHHQVCDEIAARFAQRGWRVIGITPSPILGGDGNREYLIAAEKPC